MYRNGTIDGVTVEQIGGMVVLCAAPADQIQNQTQKCCYDTLYYHRTSQVSAAVLDCALLQ